MLQSISLTPKVQKKQRICLPLSDGISRKIAKTINPRQLSQRVEINHPLSKQLPKKKETPTYKVFSFFGTNNQSSRIVDSRAIRLAQTELQDRYKCDLSGYLRKKFKKYIGKRHELDYPQPKISPGLSRSSSQEKITFRQFLTLQKYDISKHQKNSLVNEAYLKNAKQKIDRMVELKRQRQDYYRDIRALLKQKVMEKAKIRQKTDWRSQQKDEEWETQWVNQYINEKNRYRKRLFNKSINKRYQLNPP